jgi:hypothetical protein
MRVVALPAEFHARCVLGALLAVPIVLAACGGKRSVHPNDSNLGGIGASGGLTGGHAGEPDGTGPNDAGEDNGGNTGGAGGAGVSGGTAGGGSAGSVATGGLAGVTGTSGESGTGGVTAGGSAGSSGSGGVSGNPSAGTSGGAGQGGGGMAARDPEWATWPMPHPEDSGFPNPARYTAVGDLGDLTVRDEVTGLVWQRGMGRDWQASKDFCENLDGSWRLPSMIELVSLVGAPMDNDSPFEPFRGRAGSVWSSSPVSDDPASAWVVLFPMGGSYHFPKESAYATLCVAEGETNPRLHYESGMVEGTLGVRDNWTGLVWEQPISMATYTFAEAETVCEERGAGWRAPSVKELQTLIDRRRSMPSIDPTYFPGTPNDYFWSSTPYNGGIAWLVKFDHGIANTYGEREVYVRCVHADPDLASAPN